MKQLLSISKDRKQKHKTNQILQLHTLDNQQQNFIFNTNSDNEEDPPQQQILAYAQCIGIKMPEESDLLYIAREGLLAELPQDWHVQELGSGQIMYINKRTKEKSLDHPCDDYYRQKVISERKRKVKNIKGLTKIDIPKSKTSFVSNVFKKDDDQDEYISPGSMFQKTQGINQFPVLYDQEDKEPERATREQRKRKKRSSRNNEQRQKSEKQQSRMPTPPLKSGRKQSFAPLILEKQHKNRQRLEQRKKQIQRELRVKYEYKIGQAEKQNLQKIEKVYQKEGELRNMGVQEICQEYGDLYMKAKKEAERQMMQVHMNNLKKLRQQQEEQNKKQIAAIYSATDAQNLFSQMAQMRKFINKGFENPPNYLHELHNNSKFINQIEQQKISLEKENKLKNKMLQLLMQIDRSQPVSNIYQQIQKNRQIYASLIEEELPSIAQTQQKRVIVGDWQKKVQQNEKEQMSLYSELQCLREKLKGIKNDNESHQGDLTDRQNKLFQLLQNRASMSSRSNPDS